MEEGRKAVGGRIEMKKGAWRRGRKRRDERRKRGCGGGEKERIFQRGETVQQGSHGIIQTVQAKPRLLLELPLLMTHQEGDQVLSSGLDGMMEGGLAEAVGRVDVQFFGVQQNFYGLEAVFFCVRRRRRGLKTNSETIKKFWKTNSIII
jgi:hypothetical protein